MQSSGCCRTQPMLLQLRCSLLEIARSKLSWVCHISDCSINTPCITRCIPDSCPLWLAWPGPLLTQIFNTPLKWETNHLPCIMPWLRLLSRNSLGYQQTLQTTCLVLTLQCLSMMFELARSYLLSRTNPKTLPHLIKHSTFGTSPQM